MLAQSFLVSGMLFVASAMAQDQARTSASQSSAVAAPTDAAGPDGEMVSVQVVKVSNMNSTLKYYPEEIEAQPGSMVQFQFYPKSHTVTQSTFDKPCEPINSVMSNVSGIDSGPMPPENGMMKVFTMMINDTKPLWMYCATKDHCQKGMVMSINVPKTGDKTLAAYKEMAAKAAPSTSDSETESDDDSDASSDSDTSSDSDASSESGASGAATSLFTSMAGGTAVVTCLVATFALLL